MNAEATLHHFGEAQASLSTIKRDSELRRLWLEAAEASEALSAIYGRPASEAECIAAEGQAWNTRHALLDHLLTAHGLTTADLRRGVLI